MVFVLEVLITGTSKPCCTCTGPTYGVWCVILFFLFEEGNSCHGGRAMKIYSADFWKNGYVKFTVYSQEFRRMRGDFMETY